MSKNALVSVVLIFLNEERFITEAIESVIDQTYKEWELIIVDDGSIDKSTNMVIDYTKRFPNKIRYYDHKNHSNLGMSASRNLGVSKSEGDYIALIDADDLWLPNKLEQQIYISNENMEAALIYGAPKYWYSWTENKEDLEKDTIPDLTIPTDTVYDPPSLSVLLYPLGKAISPCPSDLFMKKSLIEEVGGFEEHFNGIYQVYEDQAFLSKVYLKHPVYVSNETWDFYRIHSDSCMSVVTDWYKSDNYHKIRRYYLDWFESYLLDKKFEDKEVWKLLTKAKAQYSSTMIE